MYRKLVFLLIILFTNKIISGQAVESSLSFTNTGSYVKIPSSASLSPVKEITVECWIKPHQSNWNNKPQTIISKKKYTTIQDFSNTLNWEVFEATNISGQHDVKGFVGAVFDGRYIYYSPWWKGGDNPQSGKVLRYDTHGNYDKQESWEIYDAANEDGENGVRGLEGAVFDGRYIYFVPLHTENIYSSKVLKYDTKGDFQDTDSWEVFNPVQSDYPDAVGFVGAVFDGQYIYFIPNPFVAHLKVLRYNTKNEFKDTASWEVFDLMSKYDLSILYGFFGGIFDGEYIYFVPYNSNGNVLRYNTSFDFSDLNAWQTYNLTDLLHPDFDTDFSGAVFDGRYVYFSPKSNGNVIRFDTKRDFAARESWQVMYILNLDGDHSINGGVGPVFDGRYIYFPPMTGKNSRSGNVVIYDTYKDFAHHTSWSFFALNEQDEQLAGFEGAVFDGQHIYFAPMNFDNPHGKMLRYNTTADNGLSYSLIYNQTSSSFGSVIQRPTFQVGTEQGLRTLSLKEDINLADGNWHHIAATYDGLSLKIYLNGHLNHQVSYLTKADILINDADLTIGAEAGSTNSFDGSINRVSIWNKALQEDMIQKNFTCNCLSGDEDGLVGFWPFNEISEYNRDTATDITAFNNNGYLVNHPFYESANKYIPVYAGVNEVICSNDEAFMLKDFYPSGGVWSGKGVDQHGLFTPSASLAGTTQKLVYTFTDDKNCTFSSVKYLHIAPITEQPAIKNYISSLCQGTFTTLSVEGQYNQYEWSTGDTTSSIQVEKPGSYTVKVRKNGSCESIASQPAVIDIYPMLETPTVSLTDITRLAAVTHTSGNHEYEWERDGVKLMYTEETIKVLEPGNYRVRSKNERGCYSEFSDSFFFNTENLSQALQNNIHLYPNPSSGIFNLEFSGLVDVITISIYNTIGKKLYEATIAVEEIHNTIAINLSGLPKSIYFMHIQTRYGILQKKIITH